MHRPLSLTFRLLLPLAFAATAAYAEIQVTVLPSLAPNVYGSPSWSGYTANAIYAIQNHLTSYGDPNSPTYYTQGDHYNAAQTIVTGFPSWMGYADPAGVFGAAYANELGNRMHFGVDIQATGGETFDLNHLSFNSTSSPDPGLDWSWAAGPWTYTAWRVGIAADGTVYNNGEDGSLPVVRFMYVGSGNSYAAYCPGCTTAQQQEALLDAAMASGGFTYTGTYTIIDSAGRPFSGSGTFTVDAVPEPSTAILLGTVLLGLGGAMRRRASGHR